NITLGFSIFHVLVSIEYMNFLRYIMEAHIFGAKFDVGDVEVALAVINTFVMLLENNLHQMTYQTLLTCMQSMYSIMFHGREPEWELMGAVGCHYYLSTFTFADFSYEAKIEEIRIYYRTFEKQLEKISEDMRHTSISILSWQQY
ncbi:hypothetical protein ACJX0J_034163, partial [Zea mays]